MSLNVPKLKPSIRRKRVIDYRAQGKNIQDIAEKLNVSEKTIDRDLKSVQVKAFIDEIQRQQLDDIQHEEKSYIRMQFRDKLLDKLMPKRVEQQVTAEVNQKVEVDKPVITVEDLIGEYGDVILDEVMRRRLQGDRGDSEEDTGKPMDPKSPPPSDG